MADGQAGNGSAVQPPAHPCSPPPMARWAIALLGLYLMLLAIAIGCSVIALWPPMAGTLPLSPAEKAKASQVAKDRATTDKDEADKTVEARRKAYSDAQAAAKGADAAAKAKAEQAGKDLRDAEAVAAQKDSVRRLATEAAAKAEEALKAAADKGDPVGPVVSISVLFLQKPWRIPADIEIVLFVMAVGAMGAFVHAATSFATFVGNGTIGKGWGWWYLLRPFIGAALATVFYVVLRGGLGGSSIDAANPYGAAAIAGLVGMCSKQATDKLEDIFKSAFRTPEGKGDDVRGGKADPVTKPCVTGITPPTPTTATAEVTVIGRGFVAGSTVRVGEEQFTPTTVDPTSLKIALGGKRLAAGPTTVVVVNPADRGGASDPFAVTVQPAQGPA